MFAVTLAASMFDFLPELVFGSLEVSFFPDLLILLGSPALILGLGLALVVSIRGDR